MDLIHTIVGFFQEGGFYMYPILVVFALGLAIAIERWIKLSNVRRVNRRVWDQVQPVLEEGIKPVLKVVFTQTLYFPFTEAIVFTMILLQS